MEERSSSGARNGSPKVRNWHIATVHLLSTLRPELSGLAADMAESTRMPSRSGKFHPEPLTDLNVNLSIHPARVTARRLPPSAEPSGSSWYDPVDPSSTAMTCPPFVHGHYPASSLLPVPLLSGASVLS